MLLFKHSENEVYCEDEECDQECDEDTRCVLSDDADGGDEECDGKHDARCLGESPPVDVAEAVDDVLDFHF